jgi:iron(III) transport system substrate-binding protein
MLNIAAQEDHWNRDTRCRSVGLCCRTRLFVLLVLFFLTPPAAFGAAAPQASANFEQEWAKLIAAAKQEGTLSVASGGAPSRQYRPVMDAFSKKFGINVEVSTGNAIDTVNRVLAERKAGKYTVDVALISVRENQQRLVPSESVMPFAPLLIHPEVVNTSLWYGGRHWYGDKDSKFAFIYHAAVEDKYEVWYNSDKLKEADILSVKNQSDIFDPRWKGKIQGQGMGDPSGIRQMIDAYFEPDRGPDWVKTYLTNAGVTFSDDRRILETWLVGGRFSVQFVSTAEEELRALAKKGLPVKQVFLPKQAGMIRAAGSGCCISAFANPPHPNAAKLFVNWFLSKEGQTLTHTMIPNIDRSSLRTDVPVGQVVADQQRQPGKQYTFPDAEPGIGAKHEEAQKWIFKIWESRQK